MKIPLQNNETLIVYGEKLGKNLKIVSCMNIHKYLRKKYLAFFAHVVEKNSEEKHIQDVSIVRQ